MRRKQEFAMATLALASVLACMLAYAGPAPSLDLKQQREAAGNSRSLAAPAEFADAAVLEERPGDRGQRCAQDAQARRLKGADYQHFMIRCMRR